MYFTISEVSTEFDETIQAKIDAKTKPLGALGQLEDLAKSLARVQVMADDNSTALFIYCAE